MRITVDLLRKRAEHNEGCLSDLKEIALHQQEIEKLEVLGDVCRQLEIVYLCNNYISRIEGLHHLKMLSYLNLAVNNIKLIENLEGCESLEKLDLTLNFIVDLDSVVKLRANIFLATLHLTGNPCTKIDGYRAFVAHALPQLEHLDGADVTKTERIVARHEVPTHAKHVVEASLQDQQAERIKAEMVSKGIDPFPAKYNEKGDRVYGHTPEERIQILREEQEEKRIKDEKAKKKDPDSLAGIREEMDRKQVRMTATEEMEKYGRLLLRNEGKFPYKLDEDAKDITILTVEPGKYISTTLIEIDLQPTYVRVSIKEKLLQLTFSREVELENAKVERSSITGQLKMTLQVAKGIASRRKYNDDGEEEESTTVLSGKRGGGAAAVVPSSSDEPHKKTASTTSKVSSSSSSTAAPIKTRFESEAADIKEASPKATTTTTTSSTTKPPTAAVPEHVYKKNPRVEELD